MLGYLFDTFIYPVVFIGCVALGIYSFGESIVFDITYLVLLSGTAFFLRSNRDILSALLLLIFIQLLYEVLFYLSINSVFWKLLSYVWLGYCFYRFKSDLLRPVCGALLALTIGAELYLYLEDGKGIDHLYWPVILVSLYVSSRFYFLIRPMVVSQFVSERLKPTFLDYYLHKAFFALAALEIVSGLDYVFQAIELYDSTLIYATYPYVSQVLNTALLCIAISFSIKTVRLQSLTA